MSDMLLVGTSPTSEEGKEYFLHCNDWWYDMLGVFDNLLSDTYPIHEHFTRDLLFAPPTPTMNAEECLEFSCLVEKILQDGSARTCLWNIYHTDQTQIEYFDGDVHAALAAYNAGPGNAARWYETAGSNLDLFVDTIDFWETKSYVERIYAGYDIYSHLYGPQ